MTTKARQLLQKFENLIGAAWIASEGGRMSESGVEKAFSKVDEARGEIIKYIETMESMAADAVRLQRELFDRIETAHEPTKENGLV